MKTVVVGDTHLKQRQILPRVDAAIEGHGARRVVFLGDYCDDWGAADSFALDSLRALSDWVQRRRSQGTIVDLLLGNHDFCYLTGEDGPGTQWGIAGKVRSILEEMGLAVATEANGFLLTHAGVTSAWAHDNLGQSGLASSGPSAAEMAPLLNRMFSGRSRWRALDACGSGRGGFEVPGPLWADKSELATDFLSGVDQIVGHTPVRTCERIKLRPPHSSGMRLWHARDGREGVRSGDCSASPVIWTCDTFSLTSMLAPIGDGSMLLVEDDGSVTPLPYEGLGRGDWLDGARRYYMAR